MATLEVGYSSSTCKDCRQDGRNSPAALNESGHYTVLGYGPKNGTAGCMESWDVVVSVYPVNDPDEWIERMKRNWPTLRNVKEWQVVSYGKVSR